ncbi:MAG: hypothetical protein GY911_09630 [Actinomycetales bacterium]|nr:hypothetical protein [Actinomycetales bacterium]
MPDRGVDEGAPSTAAGCGAAAELAAGSVRVFGLCVVGTCVGGVEIGVVAGVGVFDDGGAVVPVVESDDETTGESAGGAVAGRVTGAFCG